MKINKLLALTCMVCVSMAAGLRADDQKQEKLEGAGAGKEEKAHTDDTKFLEDAAKGGMAEVKMAELAAQKAESGSVKQFAERMNRDHTEANQKMQQLATKKGLTQPTALNPEHQKHLDHLSTLSGAEFDKEFIDHAIKHHQKAIKHFEKEAERGEDPAIRSFARETLPTLQGHLKIAEALKENPSASIPELSEPAGAQPLEQPDQQQQQPDQTQQQGQEGTQSTQP
jgi:predicted outer membrane protein